MMQNTKSPSVARYAEAYASLGPDGDFPAAANVDCCEEVIFR